MTEYPKKSTDATIIVDDDGMLTLYLGDVTEPRAEVTSNAEVMQILADYRDALGRPLTVTTQYPGGHLSKHTLQADGVMTDGPASETESDEGPSVDRVLAGALGARVAHEVTAAGAENESYESASSGRRVNRLSALAVGAAVVIALVVIIGLDGPAAGDDTDQSRVQGVPASSEDKFAWWSLGQPTVEPTGPNATPTPLATPPLTAANPSGTPLPTPGTSTPPPVDPNNPDDPTDPEDPGDTSAPTPPGGLAVAERTGTSLSIAWQSSTDDIGVTQYAVYLNDRKVDSTSGTSASVGGLMNATTYTLSVAAVDAAGNVSPRASVSGTTVDTVAPIQPGGLAISASTGDSLTVTWRHSRDNVGVESYVVYLDGTQVTTTTSTSARVAGLTPVTDYRISVVAVDATGNRSAESSVVGTTADSIPPTKPQGLQFSPRMDSITVSWSPSSDNIAVDGYIVYLNGSKLRTTSEASTVISGLEPGTEYTVAVKSVDDSGNTSPAASGTVRTIGNP